MMHNHHVVELENPLFGRMKQLGVLASMSETPGNIKGPAPDPGQHTDEVLARLEGQPASHTVAGTSVGTSDLPAHPLEGIVLLDLSSVIAGPLATSLVNELGARVIRIETLEGDLLRRNYDGLGANRLQAGAENISLNLRTPEGQEVFRKLASRADVLVHNMRPGAPERIGVGYEQVRRINPRIVYVYAGGYGDSGPHSDRPAMHPIGGAVAGGALAQLGRGGLPGPEVPMTMEEVLEVGRRISRANEVNPDPNSAMVISAAVLLGIYARERFGISQHILTTMLGANAYANADDFFAYEGKPERSIPDADGFGLNALYRLYRARSGWVFLACPFDEEWETLCRAIGREELLQDPRFTTASGRKDSDGALIRELERVFITRDAQEWESSLAAADVACVVAEESGMFHFFSRDPHVAENGFITEAENLRIGKYWRYGPVVNLSLTPSRVGSGPLRGQHTESILRELGYSAGQIQDLHERRVVDWEPQTRWTETDP
jgi:crotonobetainyl-CoA:carnitine CoA-transferase CaiB-like acyl-CoA transferase